MNSDNYQQQQHSTKKQEHENNSCLSIKLPSSSVQELNSDEPTTPTSSDHRIPVPATCPPAPRKPRSVSKGNNNNNNNKRKMQNIQRISVDLMVVFNAMCVPPEFVAVDDIMAGDLGAGDRAKKVKKAGDVTLGIST